MFNERELEIMLRIVAHHVTGNAEQLDGLYEKLISLANIAGMTDKGPFPATCVHPYGDRPMIDVAPSNVSFPTPIQWAKLIEGTHNKGES